LAPNVGIDIGPTILKRMGIEPAANVQGKPIPELL
jgi:arylsulfatase A-like enzyme